MRQKVLKVGALFVFVMGFVSGCASFNRSHISVVNQHQQKISHGGVAQVAAELAVDARKGGRNGVLHALEAGTYYQFMQDYEHSREMFTLAEMQIRQYEERAKVSVRDVGSNVKAAFASDLELPYKGWGFEKVMLCSLQALNYLFLNDLEGAGVEVRKADLRQKEEEENHQRELKKLEEEKGKQNVDNRSVDSVMANYAVLDDYAAKVVSSFQNAFTYFLSGVIYEASGNMDDAYIDFKKCYSLYKTSCVERKLMHLAQRLGDQSAVVAQTGPANTHEGDTGQVEPSESGGGEVVVVYFVGRVPRLKGAKFSLWTPGKNFNVAFPFYDPATFYSGENCLEIGINGEGVQARSESVLDFVPIVTQSLKKRMPGIIVRQTIRLLTKRSVEKETGKRLGLLGKLAAKVVNTVTERPDLRGWYELPGAVQVAIVNVKPGPVTLNLTANESGFQSFSQDVDVNVPNGGKALVMVQSVGTQKVVHSVRL